MAVGEAAFCHFKDLVRHRAGFIEDVETGGVGGVSAGKRLRVLFLAGGGRAEPGLFAIAVIQPVRRADKPGPGQTEPVPLLDGRPGLRFELNVGVGGKVLHHRTANRSRARRRFELAMRHQAECERPKPVHAGCDG